MPFTRAQATELLNKAEMRLYDDSRISALRNFDKAALAGRIARTRAARDRARDLLKRQRAAARMRGEGKADGIAARTARKEALLVELLERFVTARREAPAKVSKKVVAKKTVAKKPAAGKGDATRAAAKKTAARKTAAKAAAKTAASKKAASKKAASKKVASKKMASKKSAAKVPAKKATRKLSPERALENTRRLLEAKHERDRSPQPWQTLDPATGQVAQAGYQSGQAARKAQELHAGESRMASIHGSISTRDRHDQGKRDNRGDND